MSLNDTRACIHRRFERQAAATPHAVALHGPDGMVTYAELNARANRLARHLYRLGVHPGALVALCLERGAPLVTAMIAVLKTGAAYVPVDPAYPAARIAFMLADAEPALTIAERASAAALPPHAQPLLLDRARWQDEPDGDLPRDVDAGSLAYVMYTSGSTGEPKGVLIEHRQLACHVAAFTELVGLNARDRVLQFAAPAFDVLAEEVWPTLLAGATLVLRDPGPADALAAFTRQVEQRRVTVLNLPASFWHPWCDHVLAADGGARLPALRQLVVGSETVQPGRVRAWQARFGPRIAIANAYGPTEATITATAQQLPPLQANAARVPIGHPLAGTCVRVLDADGRDVAPGEAGELYIGGARLARGYLNRPELTEQRFVAIAGQRMYRTGDLVVRLPDGALDFVGRIDGQLKVHGHRVEPGDVEACLVRHPGVGAAVVVADEASGELLAYVTPADGRPLPAPAELQSLARRALPPYMVPAAYVRLDALPLTAHGKLDRRALPAPAQSAFPARDYDAPQGEAEREVAAQWCALLKLPRVGRHDDFFALGGDAPAALALVERLRDRGLAIDLPGLCRRPTVAALAAGVEHAAGDCTVAPQALVPTCAFGLRAPAREVPALARRHLEPALALRLRAQARRLGVMPASLPHVAWALVLARGAGTDTPTFGTLLPAAPSCSDGGGGPPGTLPFHLPLPGLGVLAAVRHAHAALAVLLDDRTRHCAGTPPCHALLDYRHAAHSAQPRTERPASPLVLTVDDVDEGYRLLVQSAGGVDPGRIADFVVRALHQLAAALDDAPASPAVLLDVLPPAELAQLLRLADAHTPPDTGCLHRLVEAVAARTPHAIAASCGATRLTYGALNDEANRLAHHLQALGVGPDVPVALCLSPGTTLAVAALAVLKAGGACVAVDRAAGAEYLARAMADSGAGVLLTEGGVAVPAPASIALRLDEPGPWQGMPRANPASAATSDNVAWLVVGQRGDGVPLTHRNLGRLFPAVFGRIPCGADDVWAVCAAPGSDLFAWELWGALLTGARAVFVPAGAARVPARLLRLLARERVTVLNGRADTFVQLARADAARPAPLVLRHVIFRGAAPDADTLAAWLARRTLPPRVHALHGSAEIGIHATCRELDATTPDASFGRPLPDCAIFVLDAHGRPAPLGVPGEVYVGGAGLAQAYANRPDLTARRFVAHPLAPGQRLFRTGVRARWLADGTLDEAHGEPVGAAMGAASAASPAPRAMAAPVQRDECRVPAARPGVPVLSARLLAPPRQPCAPAGPRTQHPASRCVTDGEGQLAVAPVVPARQPAVRRFTAWRARRRG